MTKLELINEYKFEVIECLRLKVLEASSMGLVRAETRKLEASARINMVAELLITYCNMEWSDIYLINDKIMEIFGDTDKIN